MATIAIVLVALVGAPAMKGVIGQTYLHDGDYLEYSVTGTALTFSLSGTLRIDISNVTNDGFSATATMTDVPGWGTETYRLSWDDNIWEFLGIGSRVDTTEVSTPWGTKVVDRYFNQNSTGNVTSYLGVDSGVAYRVEITGPGYDLVIAMTDSNLDMIRGGDTKL